MLLYSVKGVKKPRYHWKINYSTKKMLQDASLNFSLLSE